MTHGFLARCSNQLSYCVGPTSAALNPSSRNTAHRSVRRPRRRRTTQVGPIFVISAGGSRTRRLRIEGPACWPLHHGATNASASGRSRTATVIATRGLRPPGLAHAQPTHHAPGNWVGRTRTFNLLVQSQTFCRLNYHPSQRKATESNRNPEGFIRLATGANPTVGTPSTSELRRQIKCDRRPQDV